MLLRGLTAGDGGKKIRDGWERANLAELSRKGSQLSASSDFGFRICFRRTKNN